ncbi:MAG: tail fiber domain-containing protein [Dysgonamonadaceae bacterium]|jgi:hypothetical protein|nr:tail fiber domain-containing protein [Dysgonamonadaceae bacterium]
MKKIILIATLVAAVLIGFTNVKMNMNPMTSDTSLLTLDKIEALGWTEFIIMPSGRVGILQDSPSYSLHIGNFNLTCYAAINGGWILSSDRRFKENIRDLDNALGTVQGLRGVSYNHKSDTEKRQSFGFIADEVREILPNLVFEDSLGYLALNYDGFIPVLTTAIQEQQVTIEKQQKQIDELKDLLKYIAAKSPTDANYVEIPKAVLYQNNPNPWKETTEIRYELPEDATDAAIYISDLSGKLLKTLPATDSGLVTLKGSDLKAGIYAYSLVVDGVIIDTKKMLLTK